jgi:hypothetical protein
MKQHTCEPNHLKEGSFSIFYKMHEDAQYWVQRELFQRPFTSQLSDLFEMHPIMAQLVDATNYFVQREINDDQVKSIPFDIWSKHKIWESQ